MLLRDEQVQLLVPHLYATYAIAKSTDACPVLTEVFYTCLAHAKVNDDAFESRVLPLDYSINIPSLFAAIVNVEDAVKRKLRRIQSKRFLEHIQTEELEMSLKQGMTNKQTLQHIDPVQAFERMGTHINIRAKRSIGKEVERNAEINNLIAKRRKEGDLRFHAKLHYLQSVNTISNNNNKRDKVPQVALSRKQICAPHTQNLYNCIMHELQSDIQRFAYLHCNRQAEAFMQNERNMEPLLTCLRHSFQRKNDPMIYKQ